jgi:chromosome segregation ATPase
MSRFPAMTEGVGDRRRGGKVSGIYGLEKFSHLEDKIYRTIEQFKRERQERESLEREVLTMRREMSQLSDEKERLELQVERLLNERDTIKLKVEAMLDAIAVLDLEPAETAKK